MEVFINHQPYSLPENSSLHEVLNMLKLATSQGIALAVNNEVIPKTQWDSYSLQAADNITLIQATQGG